jgi:hypothetical protein
MNSPQRDHNQSSDDRDRRICRYLDGSISADQRAAFEREMLRDPSLRRDTEAFAQTDRQVACALHALLEPSDAHVRQARRQRRIGANIRRFAAAAATLLVAATAYVTIYGPGMLADRPDEASPSDSPAMSEHHAKAPEQVEDDYASGLGETSGVPTPPSGLVRGRRAAAETETGPGPLACDLPMEGRPAVLGMNAEVACSDTPARPPSRDLADRIQRSRGRCSESSTAKITREYIGVVDEDSGEVYMIQLDHLEGEANHAEADL